MKPRIGFVASVNLKVHNMRHTVNTPYITSVISAGGTPVIIPVDGNPARADEYVSIIEGLLLPGGEDVTPGLYGENPVPQVTYMMEEKDRFEFQLIRLAMEKRIPIFGICRGLQVLNVYFGGTLYQDIPSQYGRDIGHSQAMEIRSQLTHKVSVVEGTLLHKLLGSDLSANSYHHQAIKGLGKGFVVAATAQDGTIEGIENADGSIYAVQWHPEELYALHPGFRPLFAHLVEAAQSR